MATKDSTKYLSIREQIKSKKGRSNRTKLFLDKTMPKFFLLCALTSILVTLGIIYTLVNEVFLFFGQVSIIEFLTDKIWSPHVKPFHYGILPLISGSLLIALISAFVAIPIGMASAIFLSEYAPDKVRRIIKPILEVLAGIPTIVYGFFALLFVTPILQTLIPTISQFNALSAGIVVGIMIIPMIASLSEDAMTAVPRPIKEGAYALGSTRLEVALKIVVPAAFSGIMASFVLALSRAIGETMIVSLAAGIKPNLTLNPTAEIQTLTSYIVQVSGGDISHGSMAYYSIYAVGITLFLLTFIMNIIAGWISKRFREEY
jgi:phosphate transport system permease protein